MIQFTYITKSDFTPYVQMTQNIDDRFITNAVNDAYNFDVVPVMSDTMLTAILAYLDSAVTWSTATAYVVGNKVVSGGRYYTCLINNTNSTPGATNVNWGETELMEFYVDYIKPYFVLSAYARFLLWQGANITQYGIVQPIESNGVSQPITDKWRGELLADVKGKINIYLSNLNKQFNTVSGVFDSVTYTIDSTDNTTPDRGGFAIWGVGYPDNKKVKCPDEYPNGCS